MPGTKLKWTKHNTPLLTPPNGFVYSGDLPQSCVIFWFFPLCRTLLHSQITWLYTHDTVDRKGGQNGCWWKAVTTGGSRIKVSLRHNRNIFKHQSHVFYRHSGCPEGCIGAHMSPYTVIRCNMDSFVVSCVLACVRVGRCAQRAGRSIAVHHSAPLVLTVAVQATVAASGMICSRGRCDSGGAALHWLVLLLLSLTLMCFR